MLNRIGIARAFVREQIAKTPDIAVVMVTGSAARNDGVETSDIDIRVLVDHPAKNSVQ